MKWSWKVARFRGIDVSIHVTFPLLLLWIGANYWQATHSTAAVVEGLALILVLFACVVLHEFGHALTAQRFGIRTRQITLFPIGGVASMERMPEDPRQEILVALAGPAVNLAIAGLLWVWLTLTQTELPDGAALGPDGPFLYRLMVINMMIAVFNLLPAFPMDGGRVLRGVLALNMEHAAATRVAAGIGQSMAMGMFIVGLLYNPFLMLIGVFIWLGAGAEYNAELTHAALFKTTAEHSMITRFDSLRGFDTLQKAADLTLNSNQKHFPVVDSDRPPVLLTQAALLQGLRDAGEQSTVGELSLPVMQRVDVNEPMETILQRLQTLQTPLLAVTRGGALVGVIDLENVLELINIEEAIKAHQSSGGSRLM